MAAVALGAALVATAALNFFSARETATAVTRTMASDVLFGVRSAINDEGSYHPEFLKAIIDAMASHGLRYVAVAGRSGVMGAAGQPIRKEPGPPPGPDPRPWPLGQGPPTSRPAGPREPGSPNPGLTAPFSAPLWRPPSVADRAPGAKPELMAPFTAPLWQPPGVADSGPEANPGPGGLPFEFVGATRVRVTGWLRPPAEPASRINPMFGWRERPDRGIVESAWLVVEFEPRLAEQIVWRATLTLLTALIATALLVGLASVSWRSSVRAEAAADEAQRDRRLRALGQMSAVLGHELRNPLASLKGHAQLLLEKLQRDHPGRRGAETIVKESIRLEELANHILEFVRTGNVQPRPSDAISVAQAAIRATDPARVELVTEGAVPPWNLDPERMEQVLVNLIENARTASLAQSPIRLVVAASGRELMYEVQDQGEGLPEGEEDRAFEPFYARRTKGTGLGLALARRIVEGHGGTITARNRPGGGAAFRILLPQDPPVGDSMAASEGRA